MSERPARDPAALLVRAIEASALAAGVAVTVAEIRTRSWASATFEGERCRLLLYFDEPPANWLAALPDADLPVRDYFVADLCVRSVANGGVELEILLLRDG